MKIDDNKKVDILISALEERYRSIHIIRERTQGIGIWAMGLFLGAGGWLLQSEIVLTNLEKVIAISGIIIAFLALRFVYIEDLQKGFKKQQRIVVRLERSLGFFTPRAFDNLKEAIYPKGWQKSGTNKGEGKFFNSTYILLYVGITFLIVVILFSGCFLK